MKYRNSPLKPYTQIESSVPLYILTHPSNILPFLTIALPRLILSVTGGAESFVLPPTLLAKISDGLVSSASDMNTWIVTGGTDSGVMKLVGDVMAKACLENQNPIIGIGMCGCDR